MKKMFVLFVCTICAVIPFVNGQNSVKADSVKLEVFAIGEKDTVKLGLYLPMVKARQVKNLLVKYCDPNPKCKDKDCFDLVKCEFSIQTKLLEAHLGLYELESVVMYYTSAERGKLTEPVPIGVKPKKFPSGVYVFTLMDESGSGKVTKCKFSLK